MCALSSAPYMVEWARRDARTIRRLLEGGRMNGTAHIPAVDHRRTQPGYNATCSCGWTNPNNPYQTEQQALTAAERHATTANKKED